MSYWFLFYFVILKISSLNCVAREISQAVLIMHIVQEASSVVSLAFVLHFNLILCSLINDLSFLEWHWLFLFSNSMLRIFKTSIRNSRIFRLVRWWLSFLVWKMLRHGSLRSKQIFVRIFRRLWFFLALLLNNTNLFLSRFTFR